MSQDRKHCLDTSLTIISHPPQIKSTMCFAQANPKADNDVPVLETRFTLVEMAAMYNSTFAQGFSNNERQAAIRAILRHGVHKDGAHYHTKTRGGLHPAYYRFNAAEDSGQRGLTKMALTEAGVQDIFDVVRSTSKEATYFN